MQESLLLLLCAVCACLHVCSLHVRRPEASLPCEPSGASHLGDGGETYEVGCLCGSQRMAVCIPSPLSIFPWVGSGAQTARPAEQRVCPARCLSSSHLVFGDKAWGLPNRLDWTANEHVGSAGLQPSLTTCVSSPGPYGTRGGLILGVVLQPPHSCYGTHTCKL